MEAGSGTISDENHLPASLEVGTDSSGSDRDHESFVFDDDTTSVRSSVYDFLVENGRSYHAYRSGKYFLPNDETEQERLDLQHHSFKIMLNGKLNLAPIPPPSRALDVGTGTGIWAIEFAQKYPECHVVGSDLSPIQPEFVPANCRFEVGDAEDTDWGFEQKFDYIHGRALVTCFRDAPGVVRNIYENLEPGGWFELQDPCLPLRCDDGTLDGTALGEWNRLLDEGMKKFGKDLRENLSWGQYMREVGFVDVHEVHAVCAFNTWPRGRKNKLLGAMSLQNMLEGVDSMGRAIFTRILGWDAAKLDEFLVDVKKDLNNKDVHSYCGVYFVYGRKPTAEEAKSSAESIG